MSDGDEGRDFNDGGSCAIEDFKSIINQYDRSVVDSLMPFVVNLLDCLNVGYTQKVKYEAMLQKNIKDYLSLQNKEKQAKKILKQELQEYVEKYAVEQQSRLIVEKKLADFENNRDEDSKALFSRVEALEVSLLLLEKKFKHSTDCIKKLEEREANLKWEYSELLEKYSKLFREHADSLEKSTGTKRHRELVHNEKIAKHKAEVVEPEEVFTLVDASGNENETEDGENYNQTAAVDNPNIHYDYQYFEKQSTNPRNFEQYFYENVDNKLDYEAQTDMIDREKYPQAQDKRQKVAFYHKDAEGYKEDNRFDSHQYAEQNYESDEEYGIEEINLEKSVSLTESIRNMNVSRLE